MRLTVHPPLAVTTAASPPGREGTTHVHAALLLDLRLPEWGVRRYDHLHLLREHPRGDGWRVAGLSGHPLAPARCEMPELPDAAATELEAWLATQELVLYGVRELGVVSDLGEAHASFRARVLAELRPELGRLVDGPGGASPSQLAAAVASVGAAVEELVVSDLIETITTAELGILLVPPTVRLGDAPQAPTLRRAGGSTR